MHGRRGALVRGGLGPLAPRSEVVKQYSQLHPDYFIWTSGGIDPKAPVGLQADDRPLEVVEETVTLFSLCRY